MKSGVGFQTNTGNHPYYSERHFVCALPTVVKTPRDALDPRLLGCSKLRDPMRKKKEKKRKKKKEHSIILL